MSSLDERLASLKDVDVPPAPSVGLLRRRARRRNRRRLAAGVLAIAGVAAVAVVPQLRADGRAAVHTIDRPPRSTESSIAPSEAAEALRVVDEVLNAVSPGDLANDAARLWTGYPSLADDDVAGKLDAAAAIFEGRDWMWTDQGLDRVVTASAGFTAYPVVTVRSHDDGGEFDALTFLLARENGASSPMRIVRIEEPSTDISPPSASVVAAGDRISAPGVPVEGGAVASVNGVPVEVGVDHDRLTTSLVLPELTMNPVVLTMSMATPEYPGVATVVYRTVAHDLLDDGGWSHLIGGRFNTGDTSGPSFLVGLPEQAVWRAGGQVDVFDPMSAGWTLVDLGEGSLVMSWIRRSTDQTPTLVEVVDVAAFAETDGLHVFEVASCDLDEVGNPQLVILDDGQRSDPDASWFQPRHALLLDPTSGDLTDIDVQRVRCPELGEALL